MKHRNKLFAPLSFTSVLSGTALKGVPQPKFLRDSSTSSGTTHSLQGYMRQKELMELVPFSPATLWRLVKAGKFAQPVKLSDRITAWSRAEVQEWLLAREGK